MMKRRIFVVVLAILVGSEVSLVLPSEHVRLREVELVMYFWYIKFDDPSSDAWQITWSCCPEYRSLRDGNTVTIRTPYGTFRATFDKDMGLYICGSAAHLFGLPFGQLPRLEPIELEEPISP
jgi:hypothetical protein